MGQNSMSSGLSSSKMYKNPLAEKSLMLEKVFGEE